MSDFTDNLKAFYAKPFQGGDQNALQWFLFLGFLALCSIAWGIIFKHIEAAT